ncbi:MULTISPECIES: relaxase/mobilization nuclease domain-containing protein [Actinomycetes]|uniref:relaxase/mobilization nuclease domain-containing protein n=1 Tax=Actinomycetes TaxID=1760 RepID=UPI0024785CB8|nr:hypothetical protein [Amnibacterium kyonggiense]WDE72252.1 relaxase [Amnibacterium kyonggiense]
MIASISRGGDIGGLLSYLAGPGRSNEHIEQHLIAGDAAVMTMYGTDTLDRAAATEIAQSLDAPRREFGVEVTRLLTHVDPESGETVASRVDGSVWHCSLSLGAEEGQLTDDRWAAIAEDFVTRMGFAGDAAKADCRWVAVRHGLSKNGNDHVHVAVSLVREDGTKASVHNDYHRAMQAVRDLEQLHGLQPLVPLHERAFPQREETRAAREAASRRGLVEVDAKTLERYVRAASTASLDEAEFVRRLRRQGLLVHPATRPAETMSSPATPSPSDPRTARSRCGTAGRNSLGTSPSPNCAKVGPTDPTPPPKQSRNGEPSDVRDSRSGSGGRLRSCTQTSSPSTSTTSQRCATT